MLKAEIEKFFELRRFVEESIGACLDARFPHRVCRVVGEHSDPLMAVTPSTPTDNAKPRSLRQKEIHNGEIPLPLMMGKPIDGLVFSLGNCQHACRPQIGERGNQVLPDLLVVLDEKYRYSCHSVWWTPS